MNITKRRQENDKLIKKLEKTRDRKRELEKQLEERQLDI